MSQYFPRYSTFHIFKISRCFSLRALSSSGKILKSISFFHFFLAGLGVPPSAFLVVPSILSLFGSAFFYFIAYLVSFSSTISSRLRSLCQEMIDRIRQRAVSVTVFFLWNSDRNLFYQFRSFFLFLLFGCSSLFSLGQVLYFFFFSSGICFWSRVVTFQVQAEPKIRRRRLRELVTDTDEDIPVDPEDIPYTYVQLDKIAGKLTQLIDEFDVDEKVLHSLLSYRIAALENMQRLLGEDPVLVSNSHGTCMVTTPKYEVMTPMFQVSYPGSGSEMLRDLIEAMTGVKTTETKRRNDVVAIKTMYPDRKFDIHPSLLNRDMKKMIMLLRCPLHAIASKFNHIYWRKNDLEPHSVQPPLELWESWRDKNYETELKGWVDHLKYWINNIKGSNQIIISYESLTNEATGPQDALRLSMFIRSIFNEGVINPAPAFTISCLWFRAVRIFDQAHSDKSQDSSNHPLFTTLQLEATATELTNMLLKFNSERTLTPILQKYWEHTVNQIK